jgi:AraC-like DNA-binding protein
MEEGVANVKNVALLSGFEDPLYFSKVFTASEGISPKVYIQNIEKLSKVKGETK